MLCPPTTPEGRNDEKALLEQLVTFLSRTDESELAELDRALGIDKIVQVGIIRKKKILHIPFVFTRTKCLRLTHLPPRLQSGCLEPVTQTFPQSQPPTTVPIDPKLPSYPSQFPTSPSQFPAEMGTAQGMSFGAPRMAFPGNVGMTVRPGMNRAHGVPNQLRLPPNQLRLQLQQRLQGPQQVDPQLSLHCGIINVNTLCLNPPLGFCVTNPVNAFDFALLSNMLWN